MYYTDITKIVHIDITKIVILGQLEPNILIGWLLKLGILTNGGGGGGGMLNVNEKYHGIMVIIYQW